MVCFSMAFASVALGVGATFRGCNWTRVAVAREGVDGVGRAGAGGDSAGMAGSVEAAGGGLFLIAVGR